MRKYGVGDIKTFPYGCNKLDAPLLSGNYQGARV